MSRHIYTLFISTILFFVSSQCLALTVVERSFEELVNRADTILIGTVTEQKAQWENPTQQNYIVTDTILNDVETLKGFSSDTFTLRNKGGKLGPYREYYEGLPQLRVGTRYILFVENNRKAIFPIVGISQGILKVIKGSDDKEIVVPTNNNRTNFQHSSKTMSKSFSRNTRNSLSLNELKTAIRNELL